jgi:hypothetical protein
VFNFNSIIGELSSNYQITSHLKDNRQSYGMYLIQHIFCLITRVCDFNVSKWRNLQCYLWTFYLMRCTQISTHCYNNLFARMLKGRRFLSLSCNTLLNFLRSLNKNGELKLVFCKSIILFWHWVIHPGYIYYALFEIILLECAFLCRYVPGHI